MNGYPYKPGEVEVRPVSATSWDVYVRGEYAACLMARTPQLAEVLAHSIADYARCAAAVELVAHLAHEVGGEG